MNQSLCRPVVISKLTISSDCQEMATVSRFMEMFLTKHGFSETEAGDILAAVQEGVSNAIIHGNNLTVQKLVSLVLRLTNQELRITITDHGSGFNIQTLADPTIPENRLKSSGRGMMFIHAFMDEVVSRTVAGGHELLMVRKRP